MTFFYDFSIINQLEVKIRLDYALKLNIQLYYNNSN